MRVSLRVYFSSSPAHSPQITPPISQLPEQDVTPQYSAPEQLLGAPPENVQVLQEDINTELSEGESGITVKALTNRKNVNEIISKRLLDR